MPYREACRFDRRQGQRCNLSAEDARADGFQRKGKAGRTFKSDKVRLRLGSGAAAERGPVFAMLKETVREAQQQGEVRPGDPALLARDVWA